jgi:Protein of unknown function (DUF2599)
MFLIVALVLLGALASPAHATPFCRAPIARAVWTDEAQGSRLKVFPSRCGRRTAWLDPPSAFRDALAAGGRTPVHRRSLFEQFRCHAYFAPLKPSWNLEGWRPVVSPRRLVKALCNPSGRGGHPIARRRPRSLIGRLLAAITRA